jgi:hypothetical protein
MKAGEDFGPAIEKGGEDEQMTMHRSGKRKGHKRGGKRKGRRKGRR